MNFLFLLTESAKDIFGKSMSVSDTLMIKYYELLSDLSTSDFESLKKDLASGKAHPLATKKALARELVDRFCGKGAGDEAQKNFEEQFSKGNAAKDRTMISQPTVDVTWVDYLHASIPNLNMSKGELRRLMTQNAVRFYPKGDLSNEKRLSNPVEKPEDLAKGDLIKIGKHTWAEVQ
ncbi:MAG: hypothetical protein IT286_04990 [Proteobacteria bacterium]|nr:hypothetical protein [Pseudomonadota bacterium]